MKNTVEKGDITMKKVKIITDSCADLTAALLSQYDIDHVKMRTVLDGVETPADLTWTDEEAHNLYETIRSGKRITTTQVPASEFTDTFTKYVKDGYDIVYIACSHKQSGSVNTAGVVAKKIMEENEGAVIKCIDSLNTSMGEGIVAIYASQLANEGLGAEDIEAAVLQMRKNVNEFVTVHSLSSLHRAGRVSGPAAFFGNLMGVKPIIVADANGAQAAFKKVKGRQKSFEEIIALMKEAVIKPESQTLYLVHADCPKEEIDSLVAIAKREIPFKDIHVGYIGPIVGASVGPDAIGVMALGKEVTFKAGE